MVHTGRISYIQGYCCVISFNDKYNFFSYVATSEVVTKVQRFFSNGIQDFNTFWQTKMHPPSQAEP